MFVASAGDTIKVKSGTYDVDAGEAFPIEIKHAVDILGQESDVEDWPRIGGDANESSSTAAEALFRVQATGLSRTGIDIKNLYFEGEDHAGKDAPGALVVRVSSGYSAEVTFEDNVCESPLMSDAENADRPTILIEGGYGTTNVSILTCDTLMASERAAVEVRNGTDTTSMNQALITVMLRQCNLTMRDNFEALYGFAFIASGEEWVEGRLTLLGNTIDSTHAAGHGDINNGIFVSLESEGLGHLRVTHDYFKIIDNDIVDCHDNGIWLRNVPLDEGTGEHISLWDFERNNVQSCGQSGLLIEKSDDQTSAYGGYINVQSTTNMFVSNNYGVRIVDDAGGTGPVYLTNDTIANNGLHGLKLEGDDAWITSLINGIVYFNNAVGSYVQFDGGSSGWSPTATNVTTEYCDFQGLSSGQGNIDSNPRFVDMNGGDFHLDNSPWSPCIDKGDNAPDTGAALSEFDIDGDDRIIDGDADDRVHVDMGADEYQP